MKNPSGVRASRSASKGVPSPVSTKSPRSEATGASAPNTLTSVSSGAVSSYERRKWEVHYDWQLELYEEGRGSRGHWTNLMNKPMPFETALVHLADFRRRHRENYKTTRLRNVKTNEIIWTDVIV